MSYSSAVSAANRAEVSRNTALLEQHAVEYKADAAASGGGEPPAPPPDAPPDQMDGLPDGEVTIVAGGRRVSGWTEVTISGGLDQMPASFSLGMTERYPGEAADLVLNPGDPCTILLGGDVVMQGYINRTPRHLGTKQHDITVEGRSRCQDLVDCSALVPSMSIVNESIVSVAERLVAKFAGPIKVLAPDGNGDNKSYQVSISLGETPFEIISQIASYEGLLVHDDAKGDLVICRVGTEVFASGFTEGANVQSASAANSDEMLFSTYIPALMAQDSLAMIGPGGNKAGKPVDDAQVKRYRPLIVVSDQMVQGEFLAQKRAVWEATRRRGRSRSVSLTTDSWRDSAGRIWTHNVLAPVHLPTLHVENERWIVASWSLKRSPREGTTADITLMPAEAFAVSPSALTGTNYMIAQASQEAAIGVQTDASRSVTAPNAGANANVRSGEGHGI